MEQKKKAPAIIELVPERVQDAAMSQVDTNDRKPLRWGMWVLVLGFGGFMGWAALAPLDAGVHAPAVVKVANNRKTIQHLSGGTVEAILVKEGQKVARGQVLLTLNAVRAQADQGIVSTQYISARTMEARLVAERDGLKAIVFDPALLARFKGNVHLDEAVALQQRLFTTRRSALNSEIGILQENLAAAEEQLKGTLQVQKSRSAQRAFLDKELNGVRSLAAEGFVPKNRMLELERGAAALSGDMAQDYANVGRTRNQIAELKLRILQRKQEQQKEVQSQLAEAQKEAMALADRLSAIDYEVENTQIRSPIDGVVMGQNVHTVGGVVQPGARLMDVVPENAPLLVDVRVPVQSIDKIHPGLEVSVSFPAFSHAKTPNIPGEVLTLSADSLTDEATHMSYYLAQVQVTHAGMALLGANHIRPGMPASVVIKTGERTMLGYLVKPLLERMNASFKEQ